MTQQLRLFDERSTDTWAPWHVPLVVRSSRRARRLILRLVPPHTLELVVPPGVKPREVEAFVTEQRGWIERTRAEIAARCDASGLRLLPDRIDLRAVGRSLEVIYRDAPASRTRCTEAADTLIVATADRRPASVLLRLRAWLLQQASQQLKPWLLSEGRRIGHLPERVQVRLQRTRWGSCSSAGCISLNASLLFLEPAVVRYLLVHELCHLRWMNHSKRYWAHVARFEPEYLALDRRLAAAWDEIPFWVYARA